MYVCLYIFVFILPLAPHIRYLLYFFTLKFFLVSLLVISLVLSCEQPVGRTGTLRYTSISSQDSGFTSQDTLYPRPPSSLSVTQVSLIHLKTLKKGTFFVLQEF